MDDASASDPGLLAGRAGIRFLGIEPARADEVAFTAPYLLHVIPRDPKDGLRFWLGRCE